MDTYTVPELFRRLQAKGYIQDSDIQSTRDGFFAVCKTLPGFLAENGICDFPDAKGKAQEYSKFFSDWYLFAVPDDLGYTHGLFKLREQKQDAESGAPGIAVSFVALKGEVLHSCIENPSKENRQKLGIELNRVIAQGGQRHHPALKKYFATPKSNGAYLIATLYTSYIASFAMGGFLDVPEHYKKIVQLCISHKDSAKFARLPQFIEMLSERAGVTICNHEKIRITNPKHLTVYESSAILATHTGNTSVHSFAAGLEYHAKLLNPFTKLKIPFVGKSIYASALRTNMTIGDAEFAGSAPFYRPDSKIVRRQYSLHRNGTRHIALSADRT